MLEWNVYNEDITNREINIYNVFNHGGFLKGLNQMFKDIKKEADRYSKENNLAGLISLKEANKYGKHMRAFEDEALRRECSYYFWSKSEYEIVLTS